MISLIKFKSKSYKFGLAFVCLQTASFVIRTSYVRLYNGKVNLAESQSLDSQAERMQSFIMLSKLLFKLVVTFLKLNAMLEVELRALLDVE